MAASRPTRRVVRRVDIDPVPQFSARLTNKKQGLQDDDTARLLTEQGYRRHGHWKQSQTARRFVAWDGEGITYPNDKAQSYVLFGASTGDRIIKPSLGTRDCFDLLLAVENTYPDAIHVGFALQYDTNMMLRDLSRRHLLRIYYTHKCTWEGYRIEYRPGKWLSIRRNQTRVRLFDVFGFFQSSFVTACEKFLGSDDPELVGVREGKQARRSFTYDQLDTFIVPYWEAELRLLVRLMDSLRDDLTEAGLGIVSWHGPGAVANSVLRANNIRVAKAETPKEVNRGAQYAYAGGRFELFKAGNHTGTVWEYDINSAYPTAIADLPNLAAGTWQYADTFQPGSFGLWYCKHDDRSRGRSLFTKPQPLFHRDTHGNISYPPLVAGWYWTPEAALVPVSEVQHGWVFVPDDDTDKPFTFVREMYERRQQWKAEGKSAEKALKLALNSLYGKMAQRVGWTQDNQRVPQWHQLEWAGYVTSTTRASLWNAVLLAPDSIIAVETDAVFSTTRLPDLPTGVALGQWSETKFDSITYLQSGMYFATQDGKLIEKYRGFDKGSLSHDAALAHLRQLDDGVTCDCKPPQLSVDCPAHLFGVTTRFTGLGVALFTRSTWRSWVTEPRHVSFGGGGKRTHVPALCPQCKVGAPISDNLHTLAVITPGGRSNPHSLPWLTSQEPALRVADELAMW